MHKITFHFENIEIPDFDSEFFSLWLSKVTGHYGRSTGDIAYVFCSDKYLLEINQKHLDHDYYTDIITFNYNNGGVISGDMYISVERVKENALIFEVDFLTELSRVMAHGFLHLIGYNDKTEEEELEMREQETKCLILLKDVSRET